MQLLRRIFGRQLAPPTELASPAVARSTRSELANHRAKVKELDALGHEAQAEAEQRRFLAETGNVKVAASLINRLCHLWRAYEGVEIGRRWIGNPPPGEQRLLTSHIRACIEAHGTEFARQELQRVFSGAVPYPLLAAATIRLAEGDREGADQELRLLAASDDIFVRKQVGRHLHRLRVLRTSIDILMSAASSPERRGIVLAADFGSPLTQLWTVPLATELRRRGFLPLVLEQSAGRIFDPSGIARLDALQGCSDALHIRRYGEPEGPVERRHDWTIDLAKGEISVEGMNFFNAVCARIGTKLRRSTFDWDHPTAQAFFQEAVQRGDFALSICHELKRVHEETGLPVRILSGMTHYSPAAIYRAFCDCHGGDRSLEYIGFVAGYQHYYTNLSNKFSSAISTANLTRNPQLTSPDRVSRSSFEAWMASLDNYMAIVDEVEQIIGMDRAGKIHSEEAEAVRQRVLKHRASGGSVACLFGKIMYDIWMDDPSGPAHSNMIDWLNHTIEAVCNTDTLLLIKPHPNEVKQHIARPNEFFTDLIQRDLPDNVIVLDHKWFNLIDMVELIDFGLVWAGTASLELQARGVPVVVASNCGLADHPVGFLAPRDRGDYERLLREPCGMTVAAQTRKECALLIKFYSTSEVMMPHEFGTMPYLVGMGAQEVSWNDEKVDDFMRHGDQHVARMADRVLS